MPKPAFSRAHLESDLRLLDELIAFVGGLNSEQAALVMEHLHSARICLLGAMPDEYAAGLQSAKEASRWVSDKPLRGALMEALSYLQSRVSPPEASRANEYHHTHFKQHDPAPPGTTSKLWGFFRTSDTSFGIFYPKQHMVAALVSFDAAKAAEMALRDDGFDDDILVAAGSEMVNFLEELRLKAGLRGHFMARLSRTLGTEEIFVDNYIRWGRQGAGFLAVYSPMEIESERICGLLLPCDPIAIERYLTSGIQSLI